MTPAIRNFAADLLALYGGLPDPGDGVSLAALPPADRNAIAALMRADPLHDPDGADAPHPGYGIWPTGGVERYGLWPSGAVCRALAAMLRRPAGDDGPTAGPAPEPAGHATEALGDYVMPFGAFADMKLVEIDRAGFRYYLEEIPRDRIHTDATKAAIRRYLEAKPTPPRDVHQRREPLNPRLSATPG